MDDLKWILEDSRCATWVYEDGNKLVASIMIMMTGGDEKILSVGVLPSHRNRGIATKLMGWGEKIAVNQGVRKIVLEVSVVNQEAIKLYEKLGFKKVRRVPNFYSWGEDAFSMVKQLHRNS